MLTVALDESINVNSISSLDSTEVEILNIRTDTLVAHDPTQVTIRDALRVTGTITGDTKSFSIPHPLASKVETHKLIHGSVESPRYDLIYRGKVTLESGAASVNIDTVSSMTEGTLVALCRDLQSFTTNESGWTAVKSSLSGNTLSIEAQDDSCTDEISWMVIGERKDPNVVSADLTDNTGRIIVEMPLPEEEEILGED